MLTRENPTYNQKRKMTNITVLPSISEVAQMIDHALLKPTLTQAELREGLQLAADYEIFSVCVRPSDIVSAKAFFAERNSKVKVGTVIGFPHGTTTTTTKVVELGEAIANGVDEVDIVLNIGWVKSGMKQEVLTELSVLNVIASEGEASEGRETPIISKVILETAYLTPEEIRWASWLVEESGADFVKTSTGFAGGGATVENLLIMKAAVSDNMELKASGGVTSLDILLMMKELGVTRFGTSATKVILDDLTALLETGSSATTEYTDSY
jgi:deoxyribose-phosphate aldolase